MTDRLRAFAATFRRGGRPPGHELPTVAPGTPILELIRSHLDADGRLDPPGLPLPDDDDLAVSGGITWAAGAREGAFGHHVGAAADDGRAAIVAEAFVHAAEEPSDANLRTLYQHVRGADTLGMVDPLIGELAARQPDAAAIQRLGRWLATTASDTGAVKVGVAIVGATGLTAEDVELVSTLGAHDELTLYAVVALCNGDADHTQEVWRLARVVDGWGRIHCVERLRGTRDPAVRDWILREGYRNSIMDEYLAYIAATTGGLLDALRVEDPDRELLTAAGGIIEALVEGGPAEDLDDWEDGAEALELYLGHMASRASTLDDLIGVAAVGAFLDREDGWEDRATQGWTPGRRQRMHDACERILARPEWRGLVETAVSSDDPARRWRADHAAGIMGIDTFDVLVGRIRADPFGSSWYQAWQQADEPRAVALTTLAHEVLPLDAIAAGPADELGLGSAWADHRALDWTLDGLRSHPGLGGDLVLVALQSPVTRNRNLALHVLRGWPSSTWPDGARSVVEQALQDDPSASVRESATEVLAELEVAPPG